MMIAAPGRAASPGRIKDQSAALTASAYPSVVNIPGSAVNDSVWILATVSPKSKTSISAASGPVSVSQGTWKLICDCPLVLVTANIGAATPLTITSTPANSLGRGFRFATTIPLTLISAPKIVASEPGLIPGKKLAAFTIETPGGLEAFGARASRCG